MKAELIKLGLIERLMRENNVSTLERMNELITQAKMENTAENSLEAINKGEIMSLDDFKKENQKWTKKNYTK